MTEQWIKRSEGPNRKQRRTNVAVRRRLNTELAQAVGKLSNGSIENSIVRLTTIVEVGKRDLEDGAKSYGRDGKARFLALVAEGRRRGIVR